MIDTCLVARPQSILIQSMKPADRQERLPSQPSPEIIINHVALAATQLIQM